MRRTLNLKIKENHIAYRLQTISSPTNIAYFNILSLNERTDSYSISTQLHTHTHTPHRILHTYATTAAITQRARERGRVRKKKRLKFEQSEQCYGIQNGSIQRTEQLDNFFFLSSHFISLLFQIQTAHIFFARKAASKYTQCELHSGDLDTHL